MGRAIRGRRARRAHLTGVSEAVAYRIVDFSAGVVFGVRGSIERVTPRVFLLSPAQVNIKVEEPQARPRRTTCSPTDLRAVGRIGGCRRFVVMTAAAVMPS